jgi:hypothetical protein
LNVAQIFNKKTKIFVCSAIFTAKPEKTDKKRLTRLFNKGIFINQEHGCF